MAGWGYPRTTDYRQSSVLKQQALPPSDAKHFDDGLAALNLLTADRAIDPSFPPEKNIFHLSSLLDVARRQAIIRSKKSIPRGQYRVRSSVINKVSAWMLHTGQPISVEVYAKRGSQFLGRRWCSRVDALKQSWNDEKLWLHPSPSQWPQAALKMVFDACKGIAVVPVVKSQPWWWLIGEVAVDWVEVPKGHPLFVDSDGRIRQTCCPYRIVYFDAVGHPQSRSEHVKATCPWVDPQGHPRGDRSDDWDPLPRDVLHSEPGSGGLAAQAENVQAENVQVTESCDLFTLSDSALSRHELSPRKLHPVFHLKGGICV